VCTATLVYRYRKKAKIIRSRMSATPIKTPTTAAFGLAWAISPWRARTDQYLCRIAVLKPARADARPSTIGSAKPRLAAMPSFTATDQRKIGPCAAAAKRERVTLGYRYQVLTLADRLTSDLHHGVLISPSSFNA
jgi:hypothetical protein